mgnify:CR=1 FL=1
MATAIAGGVIGAMVLAFYFVPALFVLTRRRRQAGAGNAVAGVGGIGRIGAAGAVSDSTCARRPYCASGLGGASP